MQARFSKRKNMDMTIGSPVSLMMRFSVPLMFGNLFQQMYSIVDAIVIGKFVGVEAFAAVGCTSWVCWLINSFCRDSANAFCVVGSVSVGDRNTEKLRRIIANAVIYGVAASIATVAALLLGLNPILQALRIPENILEPARLYLMIYILSIPLSLVFNLATAILRAMGDSVVTFRAMTASTIVNIVLDIVFVLVFGWGVVGAAVATWLSCGVSMMIALKACSGQDIFRLSLKDLKPDKEILAEVFKLFTPMFFNSVIISVGGLYVQRATNAMGSSFSAGISAQVKIFSVLEAIIMAVQTAVSVFVGQNLGAKKIARIKEGLVKMIMVTFGMIVAMVTVAMLLRGPILDLFLSMDNPASYEEAYRTGYDSSACLLLGMLVMTPMYIHRVTIQALGHAEFSAYAGACQMVARIATISLGTPILGIYAYYIPDCMAWLVSLPIVSIPCYYYLRKLGRQNAAEVKAG